MNSNTDMIHSMHISKSYNNNNIYNIYIYIFNKVQYPMYIEIRVQPKVVVNILIFEFVIYTLV